MENLWFCEVWTSNRYGLIRNAISKDSDDEALTFQDRFRVTEILGQVPDIFEYFGFSPGSACTASIFSLLTFWRDSLISDLNF